MNNFGRAVIGSAYKGFEDPLAMWGTNRQIQQRCGLGGPESTIDHYTIFASIDGQNLAKLADVPVNQHSLDLSAFNLPSPASLYIKAVGQSSIRNLMSSAISYKAGDTPPHAALNVSLAADLTVNASTVGSSDPDGSISQTMIDFGDGTVVQGATGTHKYAAVGAYTVTATVIDNGGAAAVAVTRVEAKSAAPGVTILSPANSATVNWPTPVVASVNSSSSIRRVNVFTDGNPAYATDQGVINSALKVFTGTHHLVVQATDRAGAVSQVAVDVVAEPGDLPPTASVTMQSLPTFRPGRCLLARSAPAIAMDLSCSTSNNFLTGPFSLSRRRCIPCPVWVRIPLLQM